MNSYAGHITVFMWVILNTYVHIHIHTYIYICICISVYARTRAVCLPVRYWTNIYKFKYIHSHSHTHIYQFVCRRAGTRVILNICIRIHVHTYTFTYAYLSIHTFAYAYISIYVQPLVGVHTPVQYWVFVYEFKCMHTYSHIHTYQYICRRSWRACTRAMLSCWKWREVQILKSQIAAKDTMSIDCRADFWEFLLAQLDELMTSMLHDLKKVLDTLDTGTQKFSKVSWVVVWHSTLSSELTFENFCRCSMIVRKFWILSRWMCDMTYVCDMTHMCVTW